MPRMARAATTADVFNAVAEPQRRALLDALAGGERPVGELVSQLALPQPQVSKHLRVLREVGAVAVREAGRQRLYRVNGAALKPIHDWVGGYEQLWSDRFDALDDVLDDLKRRERRSHEMTVNTMTLEERDGRTTLRIRRRPPAVAASLNAARAVVATALAGSPLSRLASPRASQRAAGHAGMSRARARPRPTDTNPSWTFSRSKEY